MRGRGLRYLVVALLVFSILVLAGYLAREESPRHVQHQHASTTSATVLEPERLCPVANTSTSFCIVRNGKPYYFAVLGWEVPTIDELKRLGWNLRYESGLFVGLRVRTNLPLSGMDSALWVQVRGDELYRTVLSSYIPQESIALGNDTYLLLVEFLGSNPYLDEQLLQKSANVRLVLEMRMLAQPYIDLFDELSGKCLNGVCFSEYSYSVLLNYSKPPLVLRFEKALCIRKPLALLCNVTLTLKGGILILHYTFDELGKKRDAKFPLSVLVFINEAGKLKYVGLVDPLSIRVLSKIDDKVADLWKEPEHRYLGTILLPGKHELILVIDNWDLLKLVEKGKSVCLGTSWSCALIKLLSSSNGIR